MIRLENVSKLFRKRDETIRALDNVNMEVPAGAMALVRGPSGSGKTTLVNVASGLSRPSEGAVTIAGQRIDDLSPGTPGGPPRQQGGGSLPDVSPGAVPDGP